MRRCKEQNTILEQKNTILNCDHTKSATTCGNFGRVTVATAFKFSWQHAASNNLHATRLKPARCWPWPGVGNHSKVGFRQTLHACVRCVVCHWAIVLFLNRPTPARAHHRVVDVRIVVDSRRVACHRPHCHLVEHVGRDVPPCRTVVSVDPPRTVAAVPGFRVLWTFGPTVLLN